MGIITNKMGTLKRLIEKMIVDVVHPNFHYWGGGASQLSILGMWSIITFIVGTWDAVASSESPLPPPLPMRYFTALNVSWSNNSAFEVGLGVGNCD